MTTTYLVDDHPDVLLREEIEQDFRDKMKIEKEGLLKNIKRPLVVVDKDFPYFEYEVGVDGNLSGLPAAARRLYGCNGCEWRGTNICPFGLSRKERHSGGICYMRENFLKLAYRGKKGRPNFTEWQHDYNAFQLQIQANKDKVKLDEIEHRIAQLDNKKLDPSDPERRALSELRAEERKNFVELTLQLMNFDDRRLNRDHVKKIDVNTNFMGLSDIHRIMRGETLDAEYEEIKDDNNS